MISNSPVGGNSFLGDVAAAAAKKAPTPPPEATKADTAKPSNLTAQNLAQKSGNALRDTSAKVASSPFALFKSMMKGGSASFAKDLQAVRQAAPTPAAPKAEAPAPGFAVKATRFISQLSVTRWAVNDMVRDLSKMQAGDSSNLEGETSIGGKLEAGVGVASGAVSGQLKAATSVKVDCHGSAFMVTIQTHGGANLAKATSVGWHNDGVAKGRASCMQTQVFACESPQAAAELIHAFHNRGALDVPGVTPMLDDHGATRESTTTTRTVVVKGSEKATATTGVIGKLFRSFDARVTQQLEHARSTATSHGNTMETQTFSLASEKSLSMLSGVKKALTLGGWKETKVATKAELELKTVTEDASGDSVMQADLSLQMDAEKIAAMGKSFQAFGIVVEKETNRLMALMTSANERNPGTFDVSPEARDQIRTAVHNACAAIVEDGKKMQGHEAATGTGKIGGEVMGLKAEVSLAQSWGGIVTIKLPFAEPEHPTSGGPKLQLEMAAVEYGVTRTDGFKAGAAVGAELAVGGDSGVKVASAELSAESGRQTGTYVRFRVGVEADIQIDSLDLTALGVTLDTAATGDVQPHVASSHMPTFEDFDELDDLLGPGPTISSDDDDLLGPGPTVSASKASVSDDDDLLGPGPTVSSDDDDLLGPGPTVRTTNPLATRVASNPAPVVPDLDLDDL